MTEKSGAPLAAIEARKKDAQTKLASVEQALKRLLKQKLTEIDKSHLAALAGCSRTFLYQNEEARKLIAQAEIRMKPSPVKDAPASGLVDDANWRERALLAEQQLRTFREKNSSLSRTVADLLGQLATPMGHGSKTKENDCDSRTRRCVLPWPESVSLVLKLKDDLKRLGRTSDTCARKKPTEFSPA